MQPQESTLIFALLSDPSRATICRALLEAGERGLPAADLASLAGLRLSRAAHVFRELTQEGVIAPRIENRSVCYVMQSRLAVAEVLGYIDASGLSR
jgi:hypothetical protein